MTGHSDRNPESLQRLSALMDGEIDGLGMVGEACSQWREHASLRADWHAWHVIGDVMRSEDLVRDARGDAAFLATLRSRLQAEPVVLAPRPLSDVEPRRSRRWTTAAAIAAGMAMVVVGASVLMQQPGAPAPQLAVAPTSPPLATVQAPVVASVAPAPSVAAGELRPVIATEPQVLAVDGALIRDARLDRYLAAHKPLSANPALAVQSGFAGAVRSRQAER